MNYSVLFFQIYYYCLILIKIAIDNKINTKPIAIKRILRIILISEKDEELLSIWLTLWIVVEFVFAVVEGAVVEASADVDATLFDVSVELACNEFDTVSISEALVTLLLLVPDEELELEDESKVDAEVLEEPAFEVEFVEALKLELANEEALTDNANIINPDINNILINNFFLNIFPPM